MKTFLTLLSTLVLTSSFAISQTPAVAAPQVAANLPSVTVHIAQSALATLSPLTAAQTPSGAAISEMVVNCPTNVVTTVNAANSTVAIMGVTVTNGPMNCSVTAKVTDSDGMTQSLTMNFLVTVTPSAVLLSTRTVSLGISFVIL